MKGQSTLKANPSLIGLVSLYTVRGNDTHTAGLDSFAHRVRLLAGVGDFNYRLRRKREKGKETPTRHAFQLEIQFGHFLNFIMPDNYGRTVERTSCQLSEPSKCGIINNIMIIKEWFEFFSKKF